MATSRASSVTSDFKLPWEPGQGPNLKCSSLEAPLQKLVQAELTENTTKKTQQQSLPWEPYKPACVANKRQSWQGSKMLQPPLRLWRG